MKTKFFIKIIQFENNKIIRKKYLNDFYGCS